MRPLSLNQATVKPLSVADAAALCVRHEIPAIGLWREQVADAGLDAAAKTVRSAGLRVSSLCRGGFFTHADADARRRPSPATRRRSPRRPRSAPAASSLSPAAWCLAAATSDWPGG